MADVEVIVVKTRTPQSDNPGQGVDGDLPPQNTPEHGRSKKCPNSASSVQPSPSCNEERPEEDGGRKRSDPRPADIQKEGVVPVREEHKTKFYEDYRKVAEEYDKEFIKRYDEDLNTTLIFISST